MLFLSGTRDALAELDLLKPVVDGLPNGSLHLVKAVDHSFKVLKRSGMTEEAAQQDAATTLQPWASEL